MRHPLVLIICILLAVSCASTGPTPDELVPREDRYFLVSPLTDYPQSVGSVTTQRLDESFEDLLQEGDRQGAQGVASELLKRNPDLAPATVLMAQADFVGGNHDQVFSALDPVVKAYPSYVAAQLIFGRSSEKVGNLVTALESYQAIASTNQLAKSRVVDLTPRAVEIMAHRIEDALAKGHVAKAEEDLLELQSLAPQEERTLEVAADVAQATGDDQKELLILRALSRRQPEDRAQEQRLAELELAIGDSASGLRVFEDLAQRYPDDPGVAENLVRARFLWRFQLLPPDVRQLASASELSRGNFAVLVYWLFPEIRYGSAGGARIANDILQHPNREQIVRVVNAHILDVDSSLHEFEPYRPIERHQAMTAMLRLLSRQQPPFACLGGATVPESSQAVCSTALACGLIPDESDCLPMMPVPGQDALEFCRLTQELLGVR